MTTPTSTPGLDNKFLYDYLLFLNLKVFLRLIRALESNSSLGIYKNHPIG